MKKYFLALAALSIFTSCTSHQKRHYSSSGPVTQYFVGSIQVSSLDGKKPYGPPYESVVRRVVNAADGMVEECVLQNGQLFYTLITRTSEPLVYSAVDSDGSFSGKLTFGDEDLSSWSYDIQVYTPNKGNLTGSLPDHGAVIDLESKKMTIKKIWDGKVLISENYNIADKTVYDQKLQAAKSANPKLVIRETCK